MESSKKVEGEVESDGSRFSFFGPPSAPVVNVFRTRPKWLCESYSVVIWVQIFSFLEMMGVAFLRRVSFEQVLVTLLRDEFPRGTSSAE